MVLVGRQNGHNDQHGPRRKSEAQRFWQQAEIEGGEDDRQRDMQRGRLIERFVERAERLVEKTKEPGHLRLGP